MYGAESQEYTENFPLSTGRSQNPSEMSGVAQNLQAFI